MENQTKILVTGGCGFIGSNFINFLYNYSKNTIIINVDAMYYCASENNILEEIRNDKLRYFLYKTNINNQKELKDIIELHQIDTVIHFAAQSHVQNSFDDSLQFTYDNVLGTHNLLELLRNYGEYSGETKGNNKLKKIIHVSTDEVYGSSLTEENILKTEQSVLCPTNPYAATKAAAELIASSYSKSYKMPIIITRSNNAYGINQYPEKLIPKFITLLLKNEKLPIQGDGCCKRGFIHVDDLVNGFVTIIEKGTIGETYNIGTSIENEYTVIDVTKKLINLIKNTENYEEYITYVKDRPYNDVRYYICDKKLKDIGWMPQITFDNGLKELVKKYLN